MFKQLFCKHCEAKFSTSKQLRNEASFNKNMKNYYGCRFIHNIGFDDVNFPVIERSNASDCEAASWAGGINYSTKITSLDLALNWRATIVTLGIYSSEGTYSHCRRDPKSFMRDCARIHQIPISNHS